MRSFGLNPKEDELNDKINKFDIDGDGMVSFSEFLLMMVQDRDGSASNTQFDVARVIEMFDTHSNGYLDVGELESILNKFGELGLGSPSPEDKILMAEMIDEFKAKAEAENSETRKKLPNGHLLKTSAAIELLTGPTNLQPRTSDLTTGTSSSGIWDPSISENDRSEMTSPYDNILGDIMPFRRQKIPLSRTSEMVTLKFGM